MSSSSRIISLIALLFVFSVPSLQASVAFCGNHCAGAYFIDASAYPFDEHIINNAYVTVSSTTWTTLVTGCATYSGKEIRATENVNVIGRGWVQISSVSGAAGTRYELGLFVDGTQLAGVTKEFRQEIGTSPSVFVLPMSETLSGTLQNITGPANHSFELKARMVDTGSITVKDAYAIAQAVPASQYTGGRATLSGSLTLPTSTAQATPSVTVTNGTTQNIQIMPQAYFQYTAGTPETAISTIFRLTEVGGSGRVVSTTSKNVYVPCPIVTSGVCSFPAGPRDSNSIYGPVMDVPPGTWNLALFTTAGATGTQVAYRYTDYTVVPSPSGSSNLYWPNEKTTTVQVTTNGSGGTQPTASIMWNWTDWTKVLEYTVPAGGDWENMIGSIYMDIYRSKDSAVAGDWSDRQVSTAIEVVKADGTHWEWGYFDFAVNKGSQAFFAPTDSIYFGIEAGATVTLWIRKSYVTGYAQFEVRKARVDIKRFPGAASCYVTP